MTTANEGSQAPVSHIYITYLQDSASTNGYTSIRDAAIKQISYGTNASLAGTVDFSYKAPFSSSPWATAYGTNEGGCAPPDSLSTTLRCDDPEDHTTGLPAPLVMSTLSLQTVTSYVGDDSSSSHKAFSYQMTYQDSAFSQCWDAVTQYQEYCAGNHLLTQVTPTSYLHGTGHQLKSLDLGYTAPLQDYYDDTTQTINGYQYHAQTFWKYLNQYNDNQTGVGGSVIYQRAFENTHGTPTDANGDGKFDPFYCDTHTDCTGTYNWPADRTWTAEVVTSITNSGKDSSSSSLSPAATQYNYQLATLSGNDVGDTWIPKGNAGNSDADWQDYYNGEFRGFPVVYITSPANTLTVDSYASTEGWFTVQGDIPNYSAGNLREHDVYGNWQSTNWHLISSTVNTYAGDPGTMLNNANTCNGNYSGVYTPCLVAVIRSKATYSEQTNADPTSPWVQHDYTFDDINPNAQYPLVSGYHNLLKEVITSS
ncbi:MAG TPA: hypothetical protein VKX46_03745, partial [Ktedonobacteraceae bacterium]|nr:hypothetical protein [Ktedonobacteraceae bacterium]